MPRNPGGIEPTSKADYPASRGKVFKILVRHAILFLAFVIVWTSAWFGLFVSAVLLPEQEFILKLYGRESQWSKHCHRRALALLTVPRDALLKDEHGQSPQARN
jgi:hypothetical protein